MERGQHDENNAIQEFLRWQHEARCLEELDVTWAKEPRHFVPHSELVAYLGSDRRVQRLLDALFSGQDPVEQPSSKYLEQHYLRVFAILLCIGHGRFINYCAQHDSLQDQKLPFLVRPAHFPFSTGSDLFDAFRQKQWEFCAATFRYDMHNYIDKEYILPIIKKERLAVGGSAVIYKVTFLEEYNQLEPPRNRDKDPSSKRNTFILKSYRTHSAEKYYTAEKKAFMRLRNGTELPENIVGYYGSFVQDNKYYGLLEYMDRGTLEDFMEDVPPPSSMNIIKFWDHIFGLIRGLTLIHGFFVEDELDGPKEYQGWHQDITPQNILVLRKPERSIYESVFKIADFGLSHFKSTKSPKATDMDSHGTHAYGAPETFRYDDSMLQARLEVGKGVDVFSLGCVFSEVLTWSVYGCNGLLEYRHQRRRDLQRTMGIGAGHAFHDGSRVLAAVVDNHIRLEQNRPIDDHLTTNVIELINDMMADSEQRLTAKHAYQRSMRIIREANDKVLEARKAFQFASVPTALFYGMSMPGNVLEHSSNPLKCPPVEDRRLMQADPCHLSDPAERSSLQSQESNLSTSSHQPKAPNLSVKDGLDWKSKRKSGSRASIPHAELLTELENRKFVFLIDNSESMKAHMPNVKDLIGLLVYMLKRCSPNGIDFYFTSKRTKVRTATKTKDILRYLNSTVAVGRCNMEDRLGSILEDYLAKFDRTGFSRLPQDGVWQPNNEPSKAIAPLLKWVKQQDLRWNHFGIQFIRFGHNLEGMKRLAQLDGMALDIVDVTPTSGNVWKMLLGAVNEWFSDDDSNDHEDTPREDHSSEVIPKPVSTTVS